MRWDGKYRCLVIEFPVCLKNDSNPREQVWFPCLSTLAANYNWGSRQPPPLPGVKSRWDFFSFSSILLFATFSLSNSQMGKADSLRSSKKPVASEGLSMFVVNWCFYISPSNSSTRLFQTKPRLGEQPVFEEGNNFVCRNAQTHALSVQVGFYFV